MTMVGYVSDVKKWTKFEKLWQEILDREGVKQFHMTDCVSLAGEFAGWAPERRKRFIADLEECARKYTNKRFSATVIMADYNRVDATHQLHEYAGYPYSMCGISCIDHVRTWAKNRKIKDPIVYVFEDGDERKGNFPKLCQERFGFEPLFHSKKGFIPFQAADLAAWKTMQPIRDAIGTRPYTEKQVETLLYHTRAFLKKPHAGGGFDYDALMKICNGHPIPKRRDTT
ncbi:MAG: hypothetical protein LAO08_15905 [Acidobacteriia bacterium]|nr:hypothetical protein [Terriglobia bacterium]